MKPIYLSESKLQILEYLGIFKYLTTSQFIKLGVYAHRTQFYPVYKDLLESSKPLIAKVSFGVDPKWGRLENIYFLTKHGVSILIEHLEQDPSNIKYPKNSNSLFARDYFHRKYCVDFYIALKQEAEKKGSDIPWFYYYFDKVGSTRGNIPLQARTQIGEKTPQSNYIIADAIFMLERENKQSLYVMEQHNGKDTHRLISDLEKHVYALDKGLPILCARDYPYSYRVLVVVENESVKNAIIPRLQSNKLFNHFYEHIFFKTNEEVVNGGVWSEWVGIDGNLIVVI